jgi:hypothetical protein
MLSLFALIHGCFKKIKEYQLTLTCYVTTVVGIIFNCKGVIENIGAILHLSILTEFLLFIDIKFFLRWSNIY